MAGQPPFCLRDVGAFAGRDLGAGACARGMGETHRRGLFG